MCGLLTSLVLGKTLNCVNNKQLSHNLNFFGQQYYFIIILEGKSVFYIYTSLALLGICKLSLRPRRQVTVWTSLVRSLFLQAHYRMITKQLCENPSAASNFSNEASSSGEFKDDQQIGVYSNSIDGNASQETRCCFTSRKNLINTIRMVIAEMLGTFILMFCVCGIIASTQLMKGEVGLLEYAATGGLTIIVVIFSIGPISGAHVNPSVTIAFATLGQIPWSKMQQSSLVAVTLSVGFSYEVGHLAGFVVGVAIALTILVTGPVSGGSLNPARSLGPAVVSGMYDDIWLYIVAPTVGAVLGAFLSQRLRLQPRSCSSPSPNVVIAN
ncbi:hypothetical protein AQUCO_05400151v1 [Aquilegia coerulea]|uniref:Aquaporin n=1 Tax=Aquilegia coerulea TaxID=218851 RepID=A0A2G5CHV5_AQUCA|nr:hypothetical protein AQUCO_05400151v1 [Aquilegia coerulea]